MQNLFGVKEIAYVLGEKRISTDRFLPEMVAQGIDPELFGAKEIRRTDRAPLDMAEEAARAVLGQAGIGFEHADLLLYCYSFFPDRFGVPPSAMLAHRLGDGQKRCIDVYQACNGVIAALELAYMLFSTYSSVERILLVTADRIPASFNVGCFLSHGAAAALLSRDAPLRVRSVRSRNEGAFADLMPIKGGAQDPDHVDLRQYVLPPDFKKVFLKFRVAEARAVHRLSDDCLAELGIKMEDLAQVFTMNFGKYAVQDAIDAFKLPPAKVFAKNVGLGHVGSADNLINLKDWLSANDVRGKKLRVTAAGTGHFWGMCHLIHEG